MTPAVYLDRDGVLTVLVPDESTGVLESPLHPEDVVLLPGVAQAARALARAGFVLVGVTNQPAAAKQTVSVDVLETVQTRVVELLAAQGVEFDAWRICLHHPQGTDPVFGRACECRKPAPGMLLSAAEELGIDLAGSWMVGDTDADVLAGQAAGCKTLLIENAQSAHKRSGSVAPDRRARDLPQAVSVLLNG
ncbi:MAG: HAD-IIIA family hydrolase [Acidimicrobiales bacterium]